MTDSDTTRNRRYRLHLRGDHRLCLHSPATNPPPAEGSVAEAALMLAASLDLEPGDPRLVIARCAVLLGGHVDLHGPQPRLIHELSVLVDHLSERPSTEPPDTVDELRARVAERKAALWASIPPNFEEAQQ